MSSSPVSIRPSGVEKRPHPLNSLSAAEISEAVTIVKAAPEFQPNTRFTEISLHEPDKAAVWAFALQGTPVDAPRTADVVMLDGKHVIEAVVDLQNKKILSSDADQRRPRDGAAR